MKHREFAKLLQQWRERNNYSQRDAALALSCSKRTLQNWEQERAMPQGFGLRAMLQIIQGTKAAGPAKPKPTKKRK